MQIGKFIILFNIIKERGLNISEFPSHVINCINYFLFQLSGEKYEEEGYIMSGDMLFLSLLGGMGVFAFIIGVVFYVLKSIGLMTLAANKGMENTWLAWIPVADLYVMGAIVDKMNFFGFQFTNLGLWVPVIFLGGGLLGAIPVLGWLLMIFVFVFAVVFIYNLFNMYTPNAILFTVLSVFLGLFAIFLFVIRNNEHENQGPAAPL